MHRADNTAKGRLAGNRPNGDSKATTIATNALLMSFLRKRTVLGCSDFNLSLGEDSIGIYVWKAGLIDKVSVSVGDVRTFLFKMLQ
jgi:hypothetical protein